MPHMAMEVIIEANAKFADEGYWDESRRGAVAAATNLQELGLALELSEVNVNRLGSLDEQVPPAVVQGILGGYRGAALSEPPATVQVLWLHHSGFRVGVAASPAEQNPEETGAVSIIVQVPRSLQI